MKTFAETYTMRSRFFQLLGEAAKGVADAYREADRENQRNIHAMTAAAVNHSLVEHHGYTRDELPTQHPNAIASIREMTAGELAEVAVAVVEQMGRLGRDAAVAVARVLPGDMADFDEGASWIEDISARALTSNS